jgi:hypothetical protein
MGWLPQAKGARRSLRARWIGKRFPKGPTGRVVPDGRAHGSTTVNRKLDSENTYELARLLGGLAFGGHEPDALVKRIRRRRIWTASPICMLHPLARRNWLRFQGSDQT